MAIYLINKVSFDQSRLSWHAKASALSPAGYSDGSVTLTTCMFHIVLCINDSSSDWCGNNREIKLKHQNGGCICDQSDLYSYCRAELHIWVAIIHILLNLRNHCIYGNSGLQRVRGPCPLEHVRVWFSGTWKHSSSLLIVTQVGRRGPFDPPPTLCLIELCMCVCVRDGWSNNHGGGRYHHAAHKCHRVKHDALAFVGQTPASAPRLTASD